jgi:hypothetical protein
MESPHSRTKKATRLEITSRARQRGIPDFSLLFIGGGRKTVTDVNKVHESDMGMPRGEATTALVHQPVPASLPVAFNTVEADDLLAAFLSGKSPKTIEAYRRDLEDFRQFLEAPDTNHAAKVFLTAGLHNANHIALTRQSRNQTGLGACV